MGRDRARLLRDIADIAILAVIDRQKIALAQRSVEKPRQDRAILCVQGQKARRGLVALHRDQRQGRDPRQFRLLHHQAQFPRRDAVPRCDLAQRAGVSPIVMDELFDHIVKVKRTNVAILMVEQNAKQALNISDRGYVLVTGENRYSGTGQELLNNPEVRKSFLGG